MKTINRKKLVEGKLQYILQHNPDLRFQVDNLNSGRVQVVISEGWCAKSAPLILSRIDVISLLLDDIKTYNQVVDFCLQFEALIEEGNWPLTPVGGLI